MVSMSRRLIGSDQHHCLAPQLRGELLLYCDHRLKQAPCHGHAVDKTCVIQMHVVHAIDYVIIEPDREDGDNVALIAQEEFRFEGISRAEQRIEHPGHLFLSFEGCWNDRAADDNIISHMGLRSFNIAPAHGFEVRVEVFGTDHESRLLFWHVDDSAPRCVSGSAQDVYSEHSRDYYNGSHRTHEHDGDRESIRRATRDIVPKEHIA